MLRPAALAQMRRWADPALGTGVLLFGLWLIRLGGLILIPIGAALAAVGLGWAVLGWRRARFPSQTAAPGLVELDEGRLRYLHPKMGGEVSLNDLSELRLVTMNGRRIWQLSDLSGQRLLVPLDAAGAGELFDAFSALPGLGSAGLMAALAAPQDQGAAALPAARLTNERVWQRAGSGMTRQ